MKHPEFHPEVTAGTFWQQVFLTILNQTGDPIAACRSANAAIAGFRAVREEEKADRIQRDPPREGVPPAPVNEPTPEADVPAEPPVEPGSAEVEA